jgi:hypothetical protein
MSKMCWIAEILHEWAFQLCFQSFSFGNFEKFTLNLSEKKLLVRNMWKVYTRPTSASEFIFSQKWSVLFDQVSWSNFPPKYIQNYFFLLGFVKRVKQAQTFNCWTSTLEKFSKILIFFFLFSIFQAEVQPSAHKILQSCWKNVVSNKCPHLLRLQLLSIFAYFDFGHQHSKICSCRTKVVSNKCPHLIRLQLLSIFAFEIFPL